jgi:hypothetical protein
MNKAVDITAALEQKVLSVQAFYANRGSTGSSVLLAVKFMELFSNY